MIPALLLGSRIEKDNPQMTVRSHSTTRSPIGISDLQGYPIQEGYKIHSFYDAERDTYIYNPDNYDTVIVITDTLSSSDRDIALGDIKWVFGRYGCKKYLLVGGI